MTATLIDLTARRGAPLGAEMQVAKIQANFDLQALVPDDVFGDLRIAPFLRQISDLLAGHPDIAAFDQIGTECHYRFDFADSQIVGHSEICAIAEGILLQVSDAEARRPRVVSASCPDVMRIRIGLEGAEWLAREGERIVMAEGPTALVVIEPPGQPEAQMIFTGRQSMVMLAIDREALEQLWHGKEAELPNLLQAFLAGRLEHTATRRLTLKTDLLRCLDDVSRCEQDGFARTLFMRSKGLEIFCHILKMLQIDESFGGVDASLATSKGVLRAQQILKQRFVSPPSLDDLAREVGVSRSGLCSGFRQIVGLSIFGYIQELRMERALELLTETAEPITEIAYAVGYCHQSSFTVAIQRRFGMSPSDLRRSGS
jgi:AraC family transcriptional activator of pyochelin receptor